MTFLEFKQALRELLYDDETSGIDPLAFLERLENAKFKYETGVCYDLYPQEEAK